MAFYKLPRLQKISGDFSALPLPLRSCASASPFGASPWPLQGRTALSASPVQTFAVSVHGRTALWQPRGVPFGGIWAYRGRIGGVRGLVRRWWGVPCARGRCGTLLAGTAQTPNREATDQTTEEPYKVMKNPREGFPLSQGAFEPVGSDY
jgi:hypothetical protein